MRPPTVTSVRTTVEAAGPGPVTTAGIPPRVGATPPAAAPPRRSGGGTILLPPWTRAPFLPFRQPAVILAVLGAAAILACASASAALFLSSASSESLRRILVQQCADAGFPTVRATGVVGDPSTGAPATRSQVEPKQVPDARVRTAMTGVGLPQPTRVMVQDGTAGFLHGDRAMTARLFYRDGFAANVTPVGGTRPGPGVWLQAGMATRLDASVGDRITIPWFQDPPPPGAPAGGTVQVVGIYRNLDQDVVRPYWCSYGPLFLNPSYGNDATPPPLVMATDPAIFDRLRDAYGGSSTDMWVSAADTTDITLSQGRAIAGQQSGAYAAAGLPEPTDFAVRNAGTGQMPAFTERVSLIRDGLRGPVLPIALGGSLLALLLVGAAGSYWADRRYREVRLLSSRGVGPAALALKAVLELLLPAAVGTALGWLLARWLVALLGPSPRVDPSAPRQAGLTALIALVAGMALLALVAGLRSRAATERPVGARRSWPTVVPWELLLLGAARCCAGCGCAAATRSPWTRASPRSTCWWWRSRCCSWSARPS